MKELERVGKDPSRSLIRRTIVATLPVFDHNAPSSQRAKAAAIGSGGVAAAAVGTIGIADLLTQIGMDHASTVTTAAQYIGDFPVTFGGMAFGMAALSSIGGVFVAHDEGDVEACRPLLNVLTRCKVGSYLAAGGVGLIGAPLAIAGTHDTIIGGTGQVLVDIAVTAATIGASAHIFQSIWRRNMPTQRTQLGE